MNDLDAIVARLELLWQFSRNFRRFGLTPPFTVLKNPGPVGLSLAVSDGELAGSSNLHSQFLRAFSAANIDRI